jgi:hypothetical protein
MIARCKESIKQRYRFEITKENLQYCGSIILNEVQQQPIYSNVKEIIQQQQSIFENLWNKSVLPSKK